MEDGRFEEAVVWPGDRAGRLGDEGEEERAREEEAEQAEGREALTDALEVSILNLIF